MKNYIFVWLTCGNVTALHQPKSQKCLKHRLLRYLQTHLPWVRFSANFRLTSERPLALFFDTKNTFRLCLKLLRQQATVSVVCNGLATSLLPHFHIFRLHTLLQIAKQKTPQTPLTTVLANALVAKSNAMVAQSTVVAAECNKVIGFSLKNVYYFIK